MNQYAPPTPALMMEEDETAIHHTKTRTPDIALALMLTYAT